jgi:hypothetical protein
VTKEQITAALDALHKDRQWLAEATGYRYDYIKNTLAPSAPEPSEKFQRACQRVFDEEARRSSVDMSRPGASVWDQVYFSATEMSQIEQARRAGGYKNLPELYRDAILDFTENLMTDSDKHGYRAMAAEEPGLPRPLPVPVPVKYPTARDEKKKAGG